MVDLATLLDDLAAEHATVDSLVSDLTAAEWALPTAIAEWSIVGQIAHLAVSEQWAARAIADPATFDTARASPQRSESLGDATAALAAWRAARRDTLDAARAADPTQRVPWFGPPMSLASLLTARLMETWAHGVDIADALRTTISSRGLSHIADLGVRTRGFSYQLRGMPPDDTPIRVTLTDGDETLTWGPAAAAESITGATEDFCLVVTRRRPLASTGLQVTGRAAQRWMEIAQAFLSG